MCHEPQVLGAGGSVPGPAYYANWIVAVDEDVGASDTTLGACCHSAEDIDILQQTWSTWPDPTRNPPEERLHESKALLKACKEHRYLHQFARSSKVAGSVYERVRARWAQLGLEGELPELWDVEESR